MSFRRVYLGRLSYQVRERDVERLLRRFGRIREINLKNGFGFVEFDDPRDAEDAVYECNGRELLGERIIVEHARGSSGNRYGDRYGGGMRDHGGRPRYNQRREPVWLDKYGPPTRTEHRLIVENVSSRVSWQNLKDFMRQAGDITYAEAHKQRVGEGVVEYATREDMKNALRKLDGKDLNGRILRLVPDSNSYRHRSHSRSRSRDRSRSRSHDRSQSRSLSRSDRSRSHSRGRDRIRSRSPDNAKRSRSRSHSHDRSEGRRSRSGSPSKDGARESQSRSRSRSASPKKEQSRSPLPRRSPPSQEMRSRSGSPAAAGNSHED